MAGYHTRNRSDHRRYVGRRRAVMLGWRHRAERAGVTGPQRIALVVAAVATVLVGTGALAKTLPFQPSFLPVGIGVPAVAPDRDSGVAAPGPPAEAPEAGTAAGPSPPATEAAAEVPSSPAPSGTIAPASPAPTTPPPGEAPPPEPVTIMYEAEDAELSGFVRLFEMEGASGGGVIGTIGLDLLNNVRFPEVTVDTAGAYELTFYYVSASDRQGMFSVNGGEMVTVDFPALDDGRTVGSMSVDVTLAAGPNVIWFGNTSAVAPALDRITLTG
jgi:hypothetical protein